MRRCLMILASGAVLCVCLASVAGVAIYRSWAQEVTDSIEVDGRDRSYVVHLPPAYDGETPLPLVFVIHGGGGHAANAERMSGMSEVADREGFIAVYPNGTGRLRYRLLTWNAVDNCCGYALENNVDDVAFFRALVDHLQEEYAIDPDRIYATGLSNGGMMSYRLGCDASDIFAAIGPIAGAQNLATCEPTDPLSVIIFHGLEDKHVKFDGGLSEGVSEERMDTSVAEAVSFWIAHNECDTEAERSQEGKVIREAYSDCIPGTDVVLYSIIDEGHTWPGGKKGRPEADTPTDEISASEVIWEFFADHPKVR